MLTFFDNLKYIHNRILSEEKAYILAAVLFLLTLSIMVAVGLMGSSSSNSKIRSTVNSQSDNYYDVEKTLGKVVGWMQENSKYLVTPFTAANFNNNFDIGSPAEGDNEGANFAVPTMIKMKGTNNSVMLSNNAFFGTSEFPSTSHIDTSASFDAISEFQNADFGSVNARIILVWARETNGSYEPVYRVDVITGSNPDRGVHSYSYVYSNLVTTTSTEPFLGFYGEDSFSTQTSSNKCNSYKYTYGSGVWSKGAARSNCTVRSSSAISVRSKISGDAEVNASSALTLSGSGEISGNVCETSGCHTIIPSALNSWAGTCAVNQGDLTIASNTTLTPTSSNPADNCWRDITVNSNQTLTFDSFIYEYHIRKLNIKGNGKIAFATTSPNDQISLYVEEIIGDAINGNGFFNNNNAPQVVRLYYTGTRNFKFNGTSELNVCFDAPYANVTLQGNFNFYGGIKAKNLVVTGNTVFFADEDGCGGTSSTATLSDMTFSLRKASQRYRLYS